MHTLGRMVLSAAKSRDVLGCVGESHVLELLCKAQGRGISVEHAIEKRG